MKSTFTLSLASVLISLSILFLAPSQAAGLEFIELRHRSAEDLIPLLQPLLKGQGIITGRGNQLILQTTPEQLQQIRELLAQLDIPPRRLLISVRHLGQDEVGQMSAGVSGSFSVGKDVQLGSGASEGDLRARIGSHSGQRDENVIQQLQVLDGNEAFIQTGQEVPRMERVITRDGHGALRQYTEFGYQQLDTGFYVRPRVHGEQVTVEINPSRQRESLEGGGQIATQSLHTTVSGRLGEWLAIGAVQEESRDRSSSGGIDYRRGQSYQERHILLKVEALP